LGVQRKGGSQGSFVKGRKVGNTKVRGKRRILRVDSRENPGEDIKPLTGGGGEELKIFKKTGTAGRIEKGNDGTKKCSTKNNDPFTGEPSWRRGEKQQWWGKSCVKFIRFDRKLLWGGNWFSWRTKKASESPDKDWGGRRHFLIQKQEKGS